MGNFTYNEKSVIINNKLQKLIFEVTNFTTEPLLNNVAKYRAELPTILNRKLERVN